MIFTSQLVSFEAAEQNRQAVAPKRPLLSASLPLQILLAVSFATHVLVFQPDMRTTCPKVVSLEVLKNKRYVLKALEDHPMSTINDGSEQFRKQGRATKLPSRLHRDDCGSQAADDRSMESQRMQGYLQLGLLLLVHQIPSLKDL